MTRLFFCRVAIATTCLFFTTAILALGIPAGLAQNALQITKQAEVKETNLGPRADGVTGISDELFHTFQLMAQYSAAAYCEGNNNSSDTLITCSKGNCPLVEAAGARSAVEFENIMTTDDTGFLAVDETNRLIVLSFRGTHSVQNWDTDLSTTVTDTDLCAGCGVHEGFWRAWLDIRDSITPQFLHVIKDHPDFRLAITGHSLGGVVATLAAAALRDVNDDLRKRIELYSFGAPHVGNQVVADYLTMQSDRSYRITNRADAIPRLPPQLFGYQHTYPEYFISHHSKNPSPQDFRIFLKGDHGGNADTGNFLSGWSEHGAYLMKNISACV